MNAIFRYIIAPLLLITTPYLIYYYILFPIYSWIHDNIIPIQYLIGVLIACMIAGIILRLRIERKHRFKHDDAICNFLLMLFAYVFWFPACFLSFYFYNRIYYRKK